MQYNKSLDGLRAAAVFIVMLAHIGSPYPRSGGLGVDIFFVLSGFLITTIISSELRQWGSISYSDFYIRRILRLAPCLLAVCFCTWMAYYLHGSPTPDGPVLMSLTYVSNWSRAVYNYDLGLLNHTWSLAIEEQFYLVWPLVVVALERTSSSFVSKAKVLFVCALTVATYRFFMVETYDVSRIYFGLDTHMDGLVMGASLSYFILHCRYAIIPQANLLKFISYVMVPATLVGLAVMIYYITWTSPYMGYFGFLVAALGAAIVVLDLNLSTFSLLKPIFENRLLAYLGKISYGLYLWHILVYASVNQLFPEYSAFGVKEMLIKFSLSIAVASMSYHLFEAKILKLKKYFSRGYREAKQADLQIDLTSGR